MQVFSVYCNLVICKEYIPYLDEIKAVSLEKMGRLPYVSFGQDPENQWKKFEFFTDDFIDQLVEKFGCEHLSLENKYTSGIYRKEFCYMGGGFVYNLGTGTINACYKIGTWKEKTKK